MSQAKFAQAIEKIANAPQDKVFEAALAMFDSVQRMEEEEVVSFWRSLRTFWEMSQGSAPLVIRHLLEVAWARMDYIQSIGSMGDACVQIEHVMATYGQNARQR